MKVSTMRNRLHEAINLAADEKVRYLFEFFPLEVGRSEWLTLEQEREVVKDAENFIRERLGKLQDEKKAERPAGADEADRIKEFLFVLMKNDDAPATA